MSHVYFPRVIRDIGETGVQLTTLEATEGSAGNISVFVRDLRNLDEELGAVWRVFNVPIPAFLGGAGPRV